MEPGNAVKNYSKKQKQTTVAVLQPNINSTTTNATNMVGQILMTPTNVTQIDLGKILGEILLDYIPIYLDSLDTGVFTSII